uniref:Alternative protein MMP25 n=1 Tax=Homo sapiens TaxID=9606 RepID=L8ECJ7_HUMAN|nr:alternative protein MMP25 [Homo sapiens]
MTAMACSNSMGRRPKPHMTSPQGNPWLLRPSPRPRPHTAHPSPSLIDVRAILTPSPTSEGKLSSSKAPGSGASSPPDSWCPRDPHGCTASGRGCPPR